jgi:hypothetical protein
MGFAAVLVFVSLSHKRCNIQEEGDRAFLWFRRAADYSETLSNSNSPNPKEFLAYTPTILGHILGPWQPPHRPATEYSGAVGHSYDVPIRL